MRIKNFKGFTLVELIIVVAIISIIVVAAIAVMDPFAQFQKARDSRRKSDLSQIAKALETFYQDHGRYPTYVTTNFKIIPDDGRSPNYINWGSSWKPYMNILPADPQFSSNTSTSVRYAYYSPDGQSYYLYASLERGYKDSQVCSGVDDTTLQCSSTPDGVAFPFACGIRPCNYALTSPNTSP